MDIIEALQSHGSEWSLKTLKTMNEKLCPKSLIITLQEVGVGGSSSIHLKIRHLIYIYIYIYIMCC